MDKDTSALRGWRAFKFLFGKAESEANERIDTFLEDITINMESLGDGCYHTVVDNEELDAQ